MEWNDEKGTSISGASSLEPHLNSVHASLKSLDARVKTLVAYLEATQRGDVRHPPTNQLTNELTV